MVGTSMTSNAAQARSRRAPQVGELVERLERRHRVEFPRALDDRAGHRMQRLGSRLDQRLRRGVALGDPRALVEQARDLGEGLEVELDEPQRRAPRALRRRGRRRPPPPRRRRTAAGPARGTPIRKPLGTPESSGRGKAAGIAVLLVVAAGRLERGEGVGDVEREDRDRVERAAGGNDAGRRQRAERGLQADDPVERRRNAARSRGVGAERERARAPRRPRSPSPSSIRRERDRPSARCAGRHRASGRRRGRWRTGRGWSCRRRSRPPASSRSTTKAER